MLSSLISLITFITIALALPVQNEAQPTRRWLNFGYGLGDKVRGVNLGGWFVLEPYINLSLFEQFDPADTPVDEYHFCQLLGKDACLAQLQNHWATWMTADDFAQMQAAGLNHVRIPIGYWAFQLKDDDPYVQGQVQYLEQALNWCRQYNLRAWIDLHGAPGSQNGFDNSGLRDSYDWQLEENIQLTQSVISQIMATYAATQWNDVVVAIQPVNEPLGPRLDQQQIMDYYGYSYNALRVDAGSDIMLAIHDAFYDYSTWNGFMPYPEYFHVMLDHHAYQVFSPGELSRNQGDHISAACGQGQAIKGNSLWTIIGEWSAALTDCTKWLNGVGTGARYDNSFPNSFYIGSCANEDNFAAWSDSDKVNVRQYIEAQLDAYEQGLGWIFWCWKTEASLAWNFQFLIQNGLMPQPLDNRQFPNQCGF
ncbi:glycoside hydrolase superfamily [Lipomyces arxii]|uniref:glycoside hydrolase superfamily n=1 Tax=Lipomyces arxii TaxID=56418 RepID=UPI0034CFF15A